jgi:hypothetical protein
MFIDPTSVDEFAEVALKYCEWVESPQTEIDALTVHRLLAELQLHAAGLPNVDGDAEYSEVDGEKDNWKVIRDRLHSLPIHGYWKVFDVFVENENPVFCIIPDDLADIYSDLKDGLHFWLDGNKKEAVWRWRFSYYTHWGRHLTGAQTALHEFLSDQLV